MQFTAYISILFRVVVFAALLAPIAAIAQPCIITAPSSTCIDNIVNFKVNSAQAPTAWQWDFGDGNTSTQAAPGYKYTVQATRTVKVIITLPGGSTCTAQHQINIHPKPVSSFSIDAASSLCFHKNKVCITDNSTPGPTGNPIVQRVFLWDDGAGETSNNPTVDKKICHTYLQTGVYTLLMETTDDKGCLSKSSRVVSVVPDYEASFGKQLIVTPTNCKYSVCFFNSTQPDDTADIASYEWDFGDGSKETSMARYDTTCHPYDSSGNFVAKLIVKHKSGCIDTAVQNIYIAKPQINFNLKVPDVICFGTTISMFNDTSNPFALYRWYTKDSATGREELLPDATNPVNFRPLTPGKHYIKLNILRDSCHQNGFDSVIVLCPVASFELKNARLCTDGDTTYFCNQSCYYRSYNHKWMWDFNHGDACTTDTKKGLNTTKNCRFSVDEHPKHLYSFIDSAKKSSCFFPTLLITDTVTGCSSDNNKSVFLGMPPLDKLTIEELITDSCTDPTGTHLERVVTFLINGLNCGQGWDMFLNYDSAYDVTKWAKVTANPPPLNLYNFTADPSGDITLGFMVTNGNAQVASSCSTQAAKIGQTCADTVWYHRKFNMAAVPNPAVSFVQPKSCAPYNFTLRPNDTVQYNVKKILWDWGDGTVDSLFPNPGDSIIPPRYHTYWKNGLYTIILTMSNYRDCEESQFLLVALGYDNFVVYDSVVCAGDSVELKEYLSYYDKADPLWLDSARNAQGLEQVWWDFDDGNGFVSKKPETKAFFANEGTYRVRMASKDSTGCVDTFAFEIKAVKADAHIRAMRDTFYCNDNIIRFYDSSFGSPQIPGDVVTKWTWDFGDGKNSSFLRDPFHFYSSFGEKNVYVAVESKAGCRDTAQKTIYIVGPVPKFTITTDSIGCDPLKVRFENTSTRVKTWIWSLGDPSNTIFTTDKDTGFNFTYTPPGTYSITLYGADSIYNPQTGNTYFCSATYPDTPLLKQVIVIPNYPVGFNIPDTICQGNPATIRSISAARYDDFRWWMGNGDSVFTDTVVFKYTYALPGNYRIDFKPTYLPGPKERLCIADTFKNITVIPIVADFDINPQSIDPLYFFTNKSTNAVRYEWDFGHPQSGKNNFSALKDPSHNYRIDLGTFTVCLLAYNAEGCVDTICKPVTNAYEPRLFIPNVFTPAGSDSLNSRFDIDIHRAEFYHLSIFNRWGEKVFEGFDDGKGNEDVLNWDGVHYKTGIACPSGVYFVVFEYEIMGIDGRQQYHGTATIFREN